MNAEHERIAQRLEGFQFGAHPGLAGFVARLARENAWSHEHVTRVIREYKRFVCLAVTASQPVTPSDSVDRAWHLHLTYSSQYWDDFCPRVLGRPLHHHPSGGAAARQRCAAGYERTLALYRDVFGEPAPADIWPASEQRFDRDRSWVRVNAAESVVLPRCGVLAVAWGMTLVLAGLALHGLWNGATRALFLPGLALALGAAWLARRRLRAPNGARPGGALESERRSHTSPDSATPDLEVLLTASAVTSSLSTAADDAGTGAVDTTAGDAGADDAGGGAADAAACSGGGCGGCGGGCGGGD